MVSAILGKFDFTSVASAYGSPGILFLLVYLLTMIFLVLNLFISLINGYIAMVKSDPHVVPRDHEVITHFIETLKSLLGRIRGRRENSEGETLFFIFFSLLLDQDTWTTQELIQPISFRPLRYCADKLLAVH